MISAFLVQSKGSYFLSLFLLCKARPHMPIITGWTSMNAAIGLLRYTMLTSACPEFF